MAAIEAKAREQATRVQQELEKILRELLARIDSEARAIEEEFRKRLEEALSRLEKL